ncbi:MAG: BPTI/Kunitz domain-containing protein [Saprospiraceae bacterium]|nr:BPTI/Kunitz domain-containing protein [Saprospiraceae bacterium]
MKQVLLLSCFAILCGSSTCNRGANTETTMDERCLMIHDPGPCRGSFQRYYYDQESGECKQFIYGGCQGVVPFETMEECQAACGK